MAGRLFADRELYWNADKTVIVEENDPAQAFLCIHKGAVVEENFLLKTKLTFDNDGRLVLPSKQPKADTAAPKVKHWKEMNKSELESYLVGLGADVAGLPKAEMLLVAEELEAK